MLLIWKQLYRSQCNWMYIKPVEDQKWDLCCQLFFGFRNQHRNHASFRRKVTRFPTQLEVHSVFSVPDIDADKCANWPSFNNTALIFFITAGQPAYHYTYKINKTWRKESGVTEGDVNFLEEYFSRKEDISLVPSGMPKPHLKICKCKDHLKITAYPY